MGKDTLIIRGADLEDVESLWRLLHAESRTWDPEQIRAQLPQMLVLVAGAKMIGVLCWLTRTDGKAETAWIAVHPMFPENQVQMILTQALAVNSLCRPEKVIPDSPRILYNSLCRMRKRRERTVVNRPPADTTIHN